MFWTRVLLLVGGGFLAFLSFGRAEVPVAAWLAPLLLLRFARLTTGWPGLTLIGGVLYFAEAVANYGIIPISGPAYFAVIAAETINALLPYIVGRWAARLSGFASTLVFPLTWVTVDYLASHIPTKGTWGMLAHTQFGNLPLMQLVSVTGIYGITFLIAWSASVVNWAWEHDLRPNIIGRGVAIYVATFTMVLLAGSARLALSERHGTSTRAAVVSAPHSFFRPGKLTRIAQGKVREDERESFRAAMRHLQDWLFENARREARAGARVVAWPEVDALIFAEDEQALVERARAIAADEQVYLLMGIGVIHLGTPRPLENKAVLVNPSGKIEFAYLKTRPAPNWESAVMMRGDGKLPTVTTAFGRVSSAICFELDHPAYIRQAGKNQADFFFAPANDWAAIKEIHFRMAVFRAIENGVTLLRPAQSGVSGAVDPFGRILAQTDHFLPEARTMVGMIPISGGVRTFYARFGDVFAWLSMAALLVIFCRYSDLVRVSPRTTAIARPTHSGTGTDGFSPVSPVRQE